MTGDELVRRIRQRAKKRGLDPTPELVAKVIDHILGDPDAATDPTLRHGWYGTYTNHSCRCQPCRDAWAEYRRASRTSQQLDLLADTFGPTSVDSGTGGVL